MDAVRTEFGWNAFGRRMHTARFPVLDRVVDDWDALEHVVAHAVQATCGDPVGCALLLVHPLGQPRVEQAKIAASLCRSLGARAVASLDAPTLCAVAAAEVGEADTGPTCCVVDMSESGVRITPVVRGSPVHAASADLPLSKLAIERKIYRAYIPDASQPHRFFRSLTRDIFRNHLHVAADPELEAQRAADRTWTYPDPNGMVYPIPEAELFLAPEGYFCPSLLLDACSTDAQREDLRDTPSVHAAVLRAVGACDPTARSALLANVLLCGGCSALPGMGERLERELGAAVRGAAGGGSPGDSGAGEGAGGSGPPLVRVRRVLDADPADVAWHGGSVAAAAHPPPGARTPTEVPWRWVPRIEWRLASRLNGDA